jgi:hypothetical protein
VLKKIAFKGISIGSFTLPEKISMGLPSGYIETYFLNTVNLNVGLIFASNNPNE